MSEPNPAGWHPDPTGGHDHRYWDGSAWTDNVADAGVASTDPLDASLTPGSPEWADPTSSWSTTPGAPVPPIPQGPAHPEGGSRRGAVIIGAGVLVVIALVVIAGVALGGDGGSDTADVASTSPPPTTTTTTTPDEAGNGGPTDGITVPEYSEAFFTDLFESAGLSPDQAECLAGELTDAIESGELTETEASSPTALFDYLEKCDIALEEIGGN